MKIKFKSSLILLLSWLALILGAGTISAWVAMGLATKSLATVNTDIMERQSSGQVADGNHPKIMSEGEILRKVNHYLNIQQEILSQEQ
ncbi:MAG: hypothetical protein EA365_04565 [Gloeocapsa sp. DLM2.Bin57]|nr:MAG: hypothetical protein EA365_04565 [Gloeocapsa sp. DLM2.Bin57]